MAVNNSKKKCVLVAGAGGYLGTHMVPQLLNRGYKVIALDRYFFGDVFQGNTNPDLVVLKEDVRRVTAKQLADVDTVINLAAISNDPASELDHEQTKSINRIGAVDLAKRAREAGVRLYLFASSCSVYGHGDSWLTEESELAPVSEYARSKIGAEAELLPMADHNFCVTVLRKGTLHGLSALRMRFDLIINIMTLHAWKNNKIYIMGGGKQWRPLLHLDDAVEAYLMFMNHENRADINGQVFNIGSDSQNYQVNKVALGFRTIFPTVAIEETPDDPDKRNYRVSFAKIAKALQYETKRSIDSSIQEIKSALETGIITDNIKTRTVQYYRYLIDADQELKRVKLHNQLL